MCAQCGHTAGDLQSKAPEMRMIFEEGIFCCCGFIKSDLIYNLFLSPAPHNHVAFSKVNNLIVHNVYDCPFSALIHQIRLC